MSRYAEFAQADLDKVVDALTTDEAILLTAGGGFWHTHGIPRLGIPIIKVSDGPNGIRGDHLFMGAPAKCLPASTAVGATWDTKLVEEVGLKLLAPEAKLRGASAILGPTCNIQRNPLGGRSFESFAEDPLLNGLIAAAYVRGVQSGGIATTIKHFVCNDKENDRMASDSVLTERALREIYLMPFMLAQKYGDPWSYMTSYNRVNGTHVSENPFILQSILRDEWGFKGMVMSDWFGVYSIDHAINAGLDLEMPSVNKWRTLDLMNRSIGSRKITTRTVKERARKVLEFVQRCTQACPEIAGGDSEERTWDTEEEKVLMRRVAAESIVLLKNASGVLPLSPDVKKVAIVGGNAKAAVLSGGGSASLKPSFFVSPFDGLVNALGPNVEVTYSEGASTWMNTPTLEYELQTEDGKPGWVGTWYAHENSDSMNALSEPYKTQYVDETRMYLTGAAPGGVTKRWTLKMKGYLKPREKDTKFEFGLTVSGRAKLYVDGNLVIDNWTRQVRGSSFFGVGTREERGVFDLKAGKAHEVVVEFVNVRGPANGDEDEYVIDTIPGVRLGGAEVLDGDEAIAQAVQLAKEADVVIAVIGLNGDWETEGYDRTTLDLPGRTNELIEKVSAANLKTVVVNQSGSAVLMPWADSVSTIVQAWYLGNSTGGAIADVLLGKVNPGAKMSMTFPKRMEDVPSHGHFHSEHGKVHYGEDLYVGYKHFHHRKIAPQWAFGYGLSYTTFSIEDLVIQDPELTTDSFSLKFSVKVTNTGAVVGSEVVQVYVSLPDTSELTHVPLQLRTFDKVELQPGQSKLVELALDKYAVSYWEERIGRWVVEKGSYGLKVGNSSDHLPLETRFAVEKGFEWNGL